MKPQKFNVRLYVIKTHKLLPPQGVQPKDLNPYIKARADTRTIPADKRTCVQRTCAASADARRARHAARSPRLPGPRAHAPRRRPSAVSAPQVFLDNKLIRDARREARQGTDDPDFRTMVPLDVTLPGRCKLSVEVWHAAGVFSRDELLGRTDIDLEDRALNPDWRTICFPEPKGGERQESRTPVEMRTLQLDGHPRGKLEMLVDIFQARLPPQPSLPVLQSLACESLFFSNPSVRRLTHLPFRLPPDTPAAVAGREGVGRPPASPGEVRPARRGLGHERRASAEAQPHGDVRHVRAADPGGHPADERRRRGHQGAAVDRGDGHPLAGEEGARVVQLAVGVRREAAPQGAKAHHPGPPPRPPCWPLHCRRPLLRATSRTPRTQPASFFRPLPPKFPQVWDHDILTPNDFLCQGGVLLDVRRPNRRTHGYDRAPIRSRGLYPSAPGLLWRRRWAAL